MLFPKRPQHLVLVGPSASPHLSQILAMDLAVDMELVAPEQLEERLAAIERADAMLLWQSHAAPVSEVLRHATSLRWLHTFAAGVERLPHELLKARGVCVTNAAGVFAAPLAEFAVAGVLFFTRNIPRLLRQQRERCWSQFDVEDLRGRRALIVGFGGIGRATAERLKPFGVQIVACRNRPIEDPLADEVIRVDQLCEVLPSIDYLIVSAPLTSETEGMLGSRELGLLKSSAVIVNVGRGPIIVEEALIDALRSGKIRGAALDVFDREPLPDGHPFYELDNVLLSPHSADHTDRWLDDSRDFFLAQLQRVLAGEPVENVVDLDRRY